MVPLHRPGRRQGPRPDQVRRRGTPTSPPTLPITGISSSASIRVIDIWGADHHGYIERVRCVCDALGYPGKFEVLLGQLVNLLRNGKPVRMSKRKGTMVTLQELVDEVGSDAARYTLISKSSNQMVDFDIRGR